MSAGSDDADEEVRALLARLGGADAEIADAIARGDPGIGADLALRRRATKSAEEIAKEAGVEVDLLLAMYRLLGVRIDDPAEPLFRPEEREWYSDLLGATGLGAMEFRDDTSLDAAAGLRPALLDIEQGSEMLRVVGRAVGQAADAAITGYVQGVEIPLDLDNVDFLRHVQSSTAGVELGERLGRGLPWLFLHHLRQSLAHLRLAQAGSPSKMLSRYGIGFVDLVGFTSRSGRLGPDELARLLSSFEARAFGLVDEAGGHIVKQIGDEVMFVALDPSSTCDVAAALVHGFPDEQELPRGGVAFGDVLTRGGDYYGRVVNLASRLADIAVPGEVLVDGATVDAAKGHEFAPGGRRQLKGFDEPVEVWSLHS